MPSDNQLMGQNGAATFWTMRSVLMATFFVLFLGLQVAIPVVKLNGPRPSRFGWQMWSAQRASRQFFLTMRDGTTKSVNLAAHVAQGRGEVDLRDALPAHLCRVIPNVVAVEIVEPQSKTSRTHTCP